MAQTCLVAAKKTPRELTEGDITPWYTVIWARQTSAGFRAKVQYGDGSTGERVFDKPDDGAIEVTTVAHVTHNPNAEPDPVCAMCIRHGDVDRTCSGSGVCPHWSDRLDCRTAYKNEEGDLE